MPIPPSRKLTVVAQDPAVRRDGHILTAAIDVPNEALCAGPRGYRVHVIDYDASAGVKYAPRPAADYGPVDAPRDPFAKVNDATILKSPAFHSQHVYATVMRTLARFEFVLGRRIEWGFGGHQLAIAPHGMAGPNAFYSRRDRALVFGYFLDGESGDTVFSCLSQDVVVHETTHAILDGLRERFLDPSSPDQAAFHEGFADVIALLTGFAMPEVIRAALGRKALPRTIEKSDLTARALERSILLGLAEEMGSALSGVRGNPLRRSVALAPDPSLYTDPRFLEEHRRGELLVAAVMHAFLRVWERRMRTLGDQTLAGPRESGRLDADRVIEEAASIAGRLLKIMIRAIDYTPPVHLRFGDFLSAALTADAELVPDDRAFGFRAQLRESFAAYGIAPASTRTGDEPGLWCAPEDAAKIEYAQTRFESMQHDRNEVFRFLWENRQVLRISEDAYTDVLSVRACRRVGPDGFILRETVAEYLQILTLRAGEMQALGIDVGLPAPGDSVEEGEEEEEQTFQMHGGGTLVFDEYGRLKYHITNRVDDLDRQKDRMMRLWESADYDSRRGVARRSFEALHLRRMAPWPLGLDYVPGAEEE